MIRIWIVLALIAASVLLSLGIFLPTVHIEMTDPLSKIHLSNKPWKK